MIFPQFIFVEAIKILSIIEKLDGTNVTFKYEGNYKHKLNI